MSELTLDLESALFYLAEHGDENINPNFARALLELELIIYTMHTGWTVTEKGRKYLRDKDI